MWPISILPDFTPQQCLSIAKLLKDFHNPVDTTAKIQATKTLPKEFMTKKAGNSQSVSHARKSSRGHTREKVLELRGTREKVIAGTTTKKVHRKR